jgi:hypothetical protein
MNSERILIEKLGLYYGHKYLNKNKLVGHHSTGHATMGGKNPGVQSATTSDQIQNNIGYIKP